MIKNILNSWIFNIIALTDTQIDEETHEAFYNYKR